MVCSDEREHMSSVIPHIFNKYSDTCSDDLASSEDNETITSTPTTATLIEPFQGDRLFSDDENSPIRVRPPTRRDVIFSDNPNMPSLSFHVAVSPTPPSVRPAVEAAPWDLLQKQLSFLDWRCVTFMGVIPPPPPSKLDLLMFQRPLISIWYVFQHDGFTTVHSTLMRQIIIFIYSLNMLQATYQVLCHCQMSFSSSDHFIVIMRFVSIIDSTSADIYI